MDYNAYGRQLTYEEISIDQHREFVGSLWEELGRLQFEYLLSQGLKPEHRLLDLGCGALRGGLHFIRHLRTGNYTGVDANPSLLRAGKLELERSGLTFKRPSLVHEAKFRAEAWGSGYDFIISISLLTHLPKKFVKRCLSAVPASLSPQGSFHASFFEAPSNGILGPLCHLPGNIQTYAENDPYHQSLAQMETYARETGLVTSYIGDWSHPRGQRMLAFSQCPFGE